MKSFLLTLVTCLLSFNIVAANEVLSIPIYVHIVDINENISETHHEIDENAKIKASIKIVPYKTSATEKIVKKDFIEINRIWSQANIKFDLININFTKAETKNFKKYSELSFKNYDNEKHIDSSLKYHLEIVDHKKHNNDNGINVYYVPKMLSGICGAWANEVNIMLIGLSEKKFFDPNVKLYWKCNRMKTLAHEFGHTVELDHSEIVNNLMVSSGDGTDLTKVQINQSREFLKKVLGLEI